MLLRFEVLFGHGQFGHGDLAAGFGFVAVEARQHRVFADMFGEAGLQLAEGAGHLARQGGFQFRGQQHANGTGTFH
ncbi:hypothetical protein D3C76_1381940 [compost metagenome]